jgi:hypothetical protein
MRKTLTLAAALLLGSAAQAAEPANTLSQMFAQLNRCLAAAPIAAGTDVTVQFSLNRRGGLIGKPRITHAHWPPDSDPRQAASDIAARFDRCLPAVITDALGGAIAGRLIAYRLRGGAAKA